MRICGRSCLPREVRTLSSVGVCSETYAFPAADDDGSGTTSILDAFRVLAASSFAPTNSAVEFHWYSAEEGGLLGSQAVAKVYEADKVDVKGMIQMDMTGEYMLCDGRVGMVGLMRWSSLD